MKNPSLLHLAFDFWSDFGKKAAARAKQAIADIEHENYTFPKLVRDAFGLQSDALGSWMAVSGMAKPEKPDKRGK